MATQRRKQISVLTMNTTAFTVCFAVWVMFSIIGIPIKTGLELTDTQFGLLAATPILTGSLIRLPLGMWTDRYGGRIVFSLLMLSTIIPIWLISVATQYWQFLLLGLFVGVAGGSFSVGIAYTGRWFSKECKGLAMGIFGAGNAGAAVTKFVAPTLVVAYGWQAVPKVYAVAMAVTVVLFWIFTYSDPEHKVGSHVTMRDQLAALKDIRVWKYCQYYSIVFGGYVALSLWLTKYYISEYGFGIQTAALIAAIFVLPSGVIRALGGWLSDKFGAHTVTWWVMWASCISLFLLSYPQHQVIIKTIEGEMVLNLGLNAWVFTALLFIVGIAWGFGKASVFKYIGDEYPHNIGVISGIVGLMGGLGGFFFPILFGMLVDFTGINSSIFMLLFGITCWSLIWMYTTEVRGVKTLQLIASTGTEAAAAEAESRRKAALADLEKIKRFVNELETRDAVAAAIIRECERGGGVTTAGGRTGVWLDIPVLELTHGAGVLRQRFRALFKQFMRVSINIVRRPLLIYPTLHYQNGGILIDAWGETSVRNLFVAGEAAGGIHGRNRAMGNSLLDIFVFGRRAGMAAAQRREENPGAVGFGHVHDYYERLRALRISSISKSPTLFPDFIVDKI